MYIKIFFNNNRMYSQTRFSLFVHKDILLTSSMYNCITNVLLRCVNIYVYNMYMYMYIIM